MIHDPVLTDRLSAFPRESFAGTAFRATGRSVDPLAPSTGGGRWAPPASDEGGFPILYASLDRDGAIAEVASYLAMLTPLPRKPIIVHELVVSTQETLTLVRADLIDLGIDMSWYGERDYVKTQEIGAAINFLGFDGLVAPSARWRCDNLMIFLENHGLSQRLETVGAEECDWVSWSETVGNPKGG